MDIFQTSESARVVPSDALAFDLRRERAGDQNVRRLFVRTTASGWTRRTLLEPGVLRS